MAETKEVKEQTKNPQQEFLDKYNALCSEYKLRIGAYPEFELSKDTGRYGIVVKQVLIEIK